MTDMQQREAARQFFYKWNGRGREDEDARSYWIDVLMNLLGVENVTDRVDFEKKVIGPDGNTKRIDAYIPETRVLIEQKSLGIALDKPQAGHGGMTPYEQAKMYDNGLPFGEKSRWIVTSNFAEIWIYDMEQKKPEPYKLALADLQSKYQLLSFLIDQKTSRLNREMEVSLKAGELVGVIYDALLRQYRAPEEAETLKSLNALCVRLVFCLYAEDAGIFGGRRRFHDYLQAHRGEDRMALIRLFQVLDQPPEQRDPYLDEDLAAFPYVNGGLFADEGIEIPRLGEALFDLILERASADFDWSAISPTIFGAVFESTLNPDTRRAGGMHYTSIENIHKVIDPLFLNGLRAELEEIRGIPVDKTRDRRLRAYQEKLAGLKFLDPACGSGNFLTETYLSLRRLENEAIALLNRDQVAIDMDGPIRVSIRQFYGIEINDFAVTVAKTALWIAESQMMKETEDVVRMDLDFLPLKTNAHIVEGNALRMDWERVVPKRELNYIMGNPPFVGYTYQTKEQKTDLQTLLSGMGRNVDYVSGWYFKASQLMQNTAIRTAFVSTNSITQGEQVSAVWKPLYDRFGIHIDFAHRTFRWDSEASSKAHVHCVIVGFSASATTRQKHLYISDRAQKVEMINPYLIDAPVVFIEKRNKPLCSVPPMCKGSQPTDGGNLIITAEEHDAFLKKEPNAAGFIRPFLGAEEFLNGKTRFCLWLAGISPKQLTQMKAVTARVQAVKCFRLSSKKEATRKWADTPTLFTENRQPENRFIAIPEVSSGVRRYIPIGFLTPDIICSNKLQLIPNASIYHFGVITSNVHMGWMRAVCGRLKSDYDYSANIVYNNFPWPAPTEEQRARIGQTAQGILEARALYPDSSLADLYDEATMPPELRKAHQANDRAVMQAYGFDVRTTTEADCVAALMKMYQELTRV